MGSRIAVASRSAVNYVKLALPPQWSYTTHSTSPSSNLKTPCDSGLRWRNPPFLFRYKQETNTNTTKSSTLHSTTTSSNTELGSKAIHQDRTKSGTQQKTSTMQRVQLTNSRRNAHKNKVWVEVKSGRPRSVPPEAAPLPHQGWDEPATFFLPTRADYSGPLEPEEVPHFSIN